MHCVAFPVLLKSPANDEPVSGTLAMSGPAQLSLSPTGIRLTTTVYPRYLPVIVGVAAAGFALGAVLVGAVTIGVASSVGYAVVAMLQLLSASVFGGAAAWSAREWACERVVVDVPHDGARCTLDAAVVHLSWGAGQAAVALVPPDHRAALLDYRLV